MLVVLVAGDVPRNATDVVRPGEIEGGSLEEDVAGVATVLSEPPEVRRAGQAC